MSLGIVACGGDSTGPAQSPVTLWALKLNQHAVTLALTPSFDTVQLRATALVVTGAPLSTSSKVVYTVNDSSLTVDSTGLVTAKYVTPQPIPVTARLTVGNLTLTDVAFVMVTNTPLVSPLDTLSIQPQVGDSAKVGILFFSPGKNLTIKVTDVAGATIANPLIYFTSSDPTVATIDSLTGAVVGQTPGHVTFYAETDLYGVTRRDSLPYVIGNQVVATVTVLARTPVASLTPVLYFQPAVVTVGVGAVVAWRNQNADSIDVVFDDTTNVLPSCRNPFLTLACRIFPPTGAGNISAWTSDPQSSNLNGRQGWRARKFPIAGTYRYHSTRYPTSTGVIVVKTDP